MAKLDPAPQKSENVISAEQHSDLIKLPADETAYGDRPRAALSRHLRLAITMKSRDFRQRISSSSIHCDFVMNSEMLSATSPKKVLTPSNKTS